jgi:hypothetical protein
MTSFSARSLPSLIADELDLQQIPWTLEQGHGHRKLFVAGHFAGVLGARLIDATPRPALNLRSNIRRIVREIGWTPPAPQTKPSATIHRLDEYRPAPEPLVETAPVRKRVYRSAAEIALIVKDIREAAALGFPQSQIAVLVGPGQSHVHRLMVAHDIHPAGRVDEDKLRAMAADGLTATEIAREMGHSLQVISNVIKRLGLTVKRGKRGRKTKDVSHVPGLSDPVVVDRLKKSGLPIEAIAQVYSVSIREARAALGIRAPS